MHTNSKYCKSAVWLSYFACLIFSFSKGKLGGEKKKILFSACSEAIFVTSCGQNSVNNMGYKLEKNIVRQNWAENTEAKYFTLNIRYQSDLLWFVCYTKIYTSLLYIMDHFLFKNLKLNEGGLCEDTIWIPMFKKK